jgi:cytosine/adenosine deaminase-related metal-dependent hydrolase
VNFVHANNITTDEFRMIADAGASITTTPEVEMQMGMGFPATGSLLRAGGSPSLGTDVACACGPDMFSQMRIALQTQRALDHARAVEATGSPGTKVLSVREALEFATVNGARALGLEDRIGTITPGKQADVLLVKPGHAAGLAPVHDPYEAIVLNSSAANVDTVLIAGGLRKRNGQLVAPPSSREALQLAASARRLLN